MRLRNLLYETTLVIVKRNGVAMIQLTTEINLELWIDCLKKWKMRVKGAVSIVVSIVIKYG